MYIEACLTISSHNVLKLTVPLGSHRAVLWHMCTVPCAQPRCCASSWLPVHPGQSLVRQQTVWRLPHRSPNYHCNLPIASHGLLWQMGKTFKLFAFPRWLSICDLNTHFLIKVCPNLTNLCLYLELRLRNKCLLVLPRCPFLVSSQPQLSKSPRLQFLVRVYMTPAELIAWTKAVSRFAVDGEAQQ